MGQRPVITSNGIISACLLVIGLAGAPVGQAIAQLLPLPVFNTGVDKNGAPMPGESIDRNYTLVTSADPAFPGPGVFVTARIAEGLWVPNDDKSKWISPSPMQESPVPAHCNPEGAYTYRTTFNLTGFDVATASIKGIWAADSAGSALLLNGVVTGHSTPTYDKFASFELTSGFNSGVNTIDFVVTNSACPTGLRVEMSGTGLSADPADIVAIASGARHTCALTAVGGVRCWGSNLDGRLGDNSISGSQSLVPVEVSGLSSGVAAIAVGSSHSCALTTGGGLKCWGANHSGQLGDGRATGDHSPVPADVLGLSSGVAAVTAGNLFTCALTTGGGVKCWGNNGIGQLGDNQANPLSSSVPVDVSGLSSGVAAISAGLTHACALTTGGGVKCWGSNSLGELGDNGASGGTSPVPVDVTGLTSGVASVASGGSYTCAVTLQGGAKCWGANLSGQLGDNQASSPLSSPVPVNVSGLSSGVAAITAGVGYTCALTTSGHLNCWGRNDWGQLGDGTFTDRSVPTAVPVIRSGLAAIDAGDSHTCAVAKGGQATCWGFNGSGQLGDGTTTNRNAAVTVSGHTGIDSDPAPFSFPSQAGVEIATTRTTAPITPTNYFDPAPISVSGGQYSIGCTASFTEFAGTINPGQSVCVRHVASSSYSQAVTTILTIGGISATFTSTTVAEDAAPAPFSFPSQAGVGIATTRTTAPITPTDYLHPAPISVSGGQYSIGCTAPFTESAGTIIPGQSVCVRHVASSGYSQSVTTALSIGGITGTFTSTTAPAPAFSLSPASIVFGGVPVGTSSSGRTITLSNPGPNAANGLVVGAAGEFAIISSPCPSTLAGGTSCEITLVFTPIALGARADELLVVSLNSEPLVVRVPLSGTGTPAIVPPANFALTVTKSGAGTGTVTSNPVGINCGTACTANFNSGASATLTATATTGSTFTGWSGACTGTGACNVTMSSAQSVTATFTLQSFALTVAKSGGGGGVVTSTPGGIDCGATCNANFNSGVSVALGAAPSADSFFNGWSGACTGTGACNVTMDAVKSVGAEFKPNTAIPRLANISTRMQVLAGNDVLIGGFIIGGSASKTVVIRARGPSLIPFGITNALANPTMQLFSGSTVLATSDDWVTATNAADITASGFAPSSPLESAILTTLGPGAYTAVVSGVNGVTGVGIIEVFEVDRPEIPLLNISTRGQVLTGGDVMIGGFIIQGDAPQTVVVRARGPSLVPFGITNALLDPVLQLFNGPTLVATNDDWQAQAVPGDVTAIQNSGFAPADTREAVIRITLPPGAYTAIVSGKGGTTGVGIIEAFAQ